MAHPSILPAEPGPGQVICDKFLHHTHSLLSISLSELAGYNSGIAKNALKIAKF